ncbi:amidohydrolase family protein [Lentiprolixibacter aurantiacus]|uniref:Amidohydrolase family protein n=1 Tax=Lentiprolixibacter aurantiacus TaxID=2993939 RepID=A0AAE3MJ05_9FLAO|nr:amidohydrolase family protein [Lentiprolixibacter aurantiacus]MCX2718118.1 amidohydrolase family protein [Lentiprolixibacter aurantiacus]
MRQFHLFIILAICLILGCKQNVPSENAEKATNEIYTGPIIDMHLHAYTEGDGMLGITHPPTLRKQTFQGAATAEELKKEVMARFEKYNIVKAVVTSGELWINDAPDKILIAKANQPADTLRQWHEQGKLQAIAEMAPFYGGIRADNPSQLPYFKLAEELGIPVGFHILPGGPNGGFHLMPQMLGGMRVYNAEPVQLEEVLVSYPNLRIYVMHGGWPYVEDMKALMYAHPNVYADIAVVNWILPEEELYAFLKPLITAGFGDRIMHGTDQMVWPETMDVAIASINNADFLSLEEKEDIFYDNAATFLGLSEEEIAKHKSKQQE